MLSHGLFLGTPRTSQLKSPILVAVLNHPELKDEKWESGFEMMAGYRSRDNTETDRLGNLENDQACYLGKRLGSELPSEASKEKTPSTKKEISLFRNGITKRLPITAVKAMMKSSMYFDDFQTKSYCCLLTPVLQLPIPEHHSIDPATRFINPKEFFVCFLQLLLKFHLDKKSTRPTTAERCPESKVGNLSTRHDFGSFSLRSADPFLPIKLLLKSLHGSLIYLNEFQISQEPTDQIYYMSTIKAAQDSVRGVCSAILELFIEPLRNLLEQSNSQFVGLESLRTDLETATSTINRLLRFCQFDNFEPTSNHSPNSSHFDSDLQRGYCPASYNFFACLKVPEIRVHYFEQLKKLLSTYSPINSHLQKLIRRLMDKVPSPPGSSSWWVANDLNPSCSRMSDKLLRVLIGPQYNFCMTHRLGSKENMFFDPKLDFALEPKFIALIAHQEIKISILAEVAPENMFTSLRYVDMAPVIKVIRNQTEMGNFKLTPNRLVARHHCRTEIHQYFTGRYFIKMKRTQDLAQYAELWILDLGPCLLDEPKPPISSVQALSYPKPARNFRLICFSLSQRFASHLIFELAYNQDRAKRSNSIKSAVLETTLFDQQSEQKVHSIVCTELFRSIVEELEETTVRDRYLVIDNRLCWSQDLKKLFFINMTGLIQPSKSCTLLIACFRVSRRLDTMGTLTYNFFELSQLIKRDTITNRLQLHTIQIQQMDYLIIDILSGFETDKQAGMRKPAISARMMFTIYRDKLHIVRVNRRLTHSFSPTIGQQMVYAGYDSNRISLWHHRRVFSKDKIVSTLYRMKYIPC